MARLGGGRAGVTAPGMSELDMIVMELFKQHFHIRPLGGVLEDAPEAVALPALLAATGHVVVAVVTRPGLLHT